MQKIELLPVGVVRSSRAGMADDSWGGVEARIELDRERFGPESLSGLEEFSHLEVVFSFHLAVPEKIVYGARHPRNNPEWPKVGIFSQRYRERPNLLGISRCELLAVDGTTLVIRGLDAIDGTPVLDIKPVMREFEVRGEIRQPAWTTELMRDYYACE